MKIAYINKTAWLSNMPSTVFSTLNTYGFAECGHDATVIFKHAKPGAPAQDYTEFFGLDPLDSFHIHTESERRYFIKSNEAFYANVSRWMRGQSWDIMITRDPGFLPYIVRLKDATGARIFYQSHNFYLDTARQPDQSKINQKKFHRCEKQYIDRLDGLLALNNPQKKLYEEYVNVPVFAGWPGLKTINAPVDNFDRNNILYSGSFQLKKGLEELINAFAMLPKGEYTLILAGGRNENEIAPVKKMVEDLGRAESTIITGWLSYSELEKMLARATVGVIPLRDTFYNNYLTAPSKLFDYLAYGVPVIASDLPSVGDFVDGRGCSELVIPGRPKELSQAIASICNDHDKYSAMSGAAHKAADDFLWKNSSQKMLYFMMNPGK